MYVQSLIHRRQNHVKILIITFWILNDTAPFGRRIKFLNFLLGSMGIEKVILLVIKIFTWFYQKWLSKFQITSANKIELWQIKKNIQHSASALVFGQKLNIFQSSAFSFSQMWKCNFGHSLLQALEYTIHTPL
jgi:hypothetical protein